MNPHSVDADAPLRRRSRLPLPPGPLAGFVVAVLAVGLIAFFTNQALRGNAETAQLISHTMQVIQEAQSLLSSAKDAETGQRGFLLTRDESYLTPYRDARANIPSELKTARALTVDSPEQQRRLDALEQLLNLKMTELEQTLTLARGGDVNAALAVVRTDRGREIMDRIRAQVADIERSERDLLATRQAQWQAATRFTSIITIGGSALLLVLIATAAAMTSRDYRARETQAWLRAGQAAFTARIQGEQRLDALGNHVLELLADFLDAQVGALYIAEGDSTLRRVAGYAIPREQATDVLRPGDGLLGQAARENRALRVRDVPEAFLPVASSVGRGKTREVLVAPATVDGVVQAVVELGFFRSVDAADQDLLARVSESLGIAVRASKDRTLLEDLLAETQRQAEELQTQQEELRVSNEELEVQTRALKESQLRLEAQQVELEQTNSQLEEQAQILEHQKDALGKAQGVLAEKATELERSNQYKSEFLANMSHELRTPLNSTLILAKLLADNKPGNLTEEQVKFANTISSAGKELLSLINDILDLSRIEAGKMEVMAEPVSLARTLEGLTQSFQLVASQKGLRFSAEAERGTPAQIETDPQRLGQILKNLLSNAIKFTQRGEVSLRVSAASDGAVSFTVRDTGIGIPAHQQDLIFEAFRQADGSTHRKFGGSGLGLSISRDLARVLGGDVTLHSVPNEGSTFTLTLPLTFSGRARATASTPRPNALSGEPSAQQEAGGSYAAPSRAPAPRKPPSGAEALKPIEMEDDRDRLDPHSRLILIVEDDPRFAEILRDLAHEMGFQCIVTHTASEGLSAATLYHPSAVLLDVNLPDHSGLGVLDQLKRNSRTRHIPVHVASVADFTQEALELGAIGYALKPVKREELVEAFRKMEAKFSQSLRRVLVVEDDERQRESIRQLLAGKDVEIVGVATASEAFAELQKVTFDCMVVDLSLPDLSGYELLEKMAHRDEVAFPPVIVYTGRALTSQEEQRLRRFSRSIIIKDARSPERLLDEVTLFLHQVEANLPTERQRMLQAARDRDTAMDGKRILVVEDDARNIFALSSLLEPKGARIEIARNGREALEKLAQSQSRPETAIDLVLMDIMMPEMDGLTATQEIRKRPEWARLPIIALTAKARKDDQEKCLAAGANDYIAKPLDVEKLLSLVRVWMPR